MGPGEKNECEVVDEGLIGEEGITAITGSDTVPHSILGRWLSFKPDSSWPGLGEGSSSEISTSSSDRALSSTHGTSKVPSPPAWMLTTQTPTRSTTMPRATKPRCKGEISVN